MSECMDHVFGGLREIHPVADDRAAVRAAARTAAPFFFAWRQRRRRLEDRNKLKVGVPSSCKGQTRPRRSRHGRLRDRIRAVSHRIRQAARLTDAAAGRNEHTTLEANVGGQTDGCSDPLLGENQPMSAECGPVSLEELGSHITNRVDVSEMGDEEFNRRMKRHAFLFMLHIAESSSTTEEYFKRLFHSKGITSEGPDRVRNVLYYETRILASALDDLVIRDKIDAFRCRGAERILRRLLAITLALRPVTSAANLDRADWKVAEVIDLPIESVRPDLKGLRRARAEASKRVAHRVRLQRIAQKVKKWGKPFGAYFNTLVSGCSDHDVEQVRKIAFGNSNGGTFTDDVSQIYNVFLPM